MQTRRYSSVLAVYHRVGGGRAIPVTGTRHAGSGMALGVSGRVADTPPPTRGYGPPDTGFPGRAESGADFSGVLAALRARTRRGTRTRVGRIRTAALTAVHTRGVYRHPYDDPYSDPYSDPYGDRYRGAGPGARRRRQSSGGSRPSPPTSKKAPGGGQTPVLSCRIRQSGGLEAACRVGHDVLAVTCRVGHDALTCTNATGERWCSRPS